ncbi:hypothetical protein [Paraburkholderia sp. GAS334]|uniref:hypothetical protein n=1 Tax=Paraburkholderia sp. GAS334 TaxID=3035131 RepID=UPI003D2213E1
MKSSLPMVKPIALKRPRGAHRFDAFSRKLQRRLTFCRRSLLEVWMLLETDPMVIDFCERPGYMRIDGRLRLVDFWVRYVDKYELVILNDTDFMDCDSEAGRSQCSLDGNALSIRRIAPAELAAARVWIDNWQRMLPYVVANRGRIPPTLSEAIVRFVASPQRLLAIEREFSTGDPVLCRAALLALLCSGRVTAPELHTQPLSLLTSFVQAEAGS